MGKGQDHGDTDDTDGTRKGHENGTCQLGTQIVEGQGKSREKGHGCLSHVLMLRTHVVELLVRHGLCIGRDMTVL